MSSTLLRPGRPFSGFRVGAGLMAMLVGMLINMLSANAFVPTNALAFAVLGQATSHQKITSDAITDLYPEFFGIAKATKPMKKAIEEITDANAEVDEDQFSSAKHFDGENFAGGQSFVTNNLKKIKDALNADDASTARFALGQALHAIQDFYSHSSWVEKGNAAPNPNLGRSGQTIGGTAGATEATCQDCVAETIPFCNDCSVNVVTPNLTSGYYGGEDRPLPASPRKCSHGGPFDSTAPDPGVLSFTFGINKDTSDCAFSPHHTDHGAAVSVATLATKQFLRDVRDSVTHRQLKLLLGVGPTLAIAIDVTGSMGPVISRVKQQAINIVDARVGTDEEPSKYVLVPFSDPGVGPAFVSSNPDEFKARISALGASGGGDCPELSYAGMLQAIAAADKGGDLFMFTDASAKDAGLAGSVSSLAVSKEIKVFPIRFGDCGGFSPASGRQTVALTGNSSSRFSIRTPAITTGGTEYADVANPTGGQVFSLAVSEAGKITELADFVVLSNVVDILSIAADFSAGPMSYTVPVNSDMSSVTFSVSGTTTVSIHRPDGSTVGAGDPGVEIITLGTGAIYSIEAPASGVWSILLNGSGGFTMNVTGESALDMASFDFVELSGRPGHQGYFPIDGQPLAGETNNAIAVMSGDYATTEFRLQRKDGSTLDSFGLDHAPGQGENEFFGEVTLPNEPFLVYAAGLDMSGAPYQRVLPGLALAQTVSIVAPGKQGLPAGQTAVFTFRVNNLGSDDRFVATGADNQGFLGRIIPASFDLTSGGSIDVDVELDVPAGTPANTAVTLTVVVKSSTNPSKQNFAVLTDFVEAGVPPSAEAGGTYWSLLSEPVLFDAGESLDPDGEIVSYSWDWEDDGTYDDETSVATIYHRWDTLFNGPVRLRVTDNDGLTGEDVAQVIVTVPGDVDGDFDVDTDDISILRDGLGSSAWGSSDPRDLNDDGAVDGVDLKLAWPMCTRPRCATGDRTVTRLR